MMAIGVALGTAEVLLLDGKFLPGFHSSPSDPKRGVTGFGATFFDAVWIASTLITLTVHSLVDSSLPCATLEPTSALDPETALAVENYTLSMLRRPDSSVKAIIWITHSEEQGHRVGTRFITIAGGKAHEGSSADLV
jgi:hypothetical protein